MGAVVMVLCICIAIPLGVHESLTEKRDSVQSVYYYDKTGYAIYEGVDIRTEAAQNLITVAQRYETDNSNLTPLINELDRAVKYSQNSYNIRDVKLANEGLTEPAQNLADALEKIDLSESDAKYPRTLTATMIAEQDKIIRSSYNEEAAEYNSYLDAFPINVLSTIASVEPLAIFE